jgi:hypothetical protein
MIYTRLFTGTYFEKEGSFGIEQNTLAPAAGKALLPWKRSNEPGAACGGNKFDLDQWDDNYFKRLRSFISGAEKKGIIVEVTLFSSIYDYWDTQAWNPKNNINIKDSLGKKDVQILKNDKILKYQENFVRKIVRELNEFDNITYEIQNEPWCDHTVLIKMDSSDMRKDKDRQEWQNKIEIADQSSLEWQSKIASFITDEEKTLRNKHLIAQNYSNHFFKIPEVDPNISILNFHYAYPLAVDLNIRYPKVIGYDESGFAGTEDATYRKEAWRFIMAGGGLFNNLDYSFSAGHEDGKAVNKAPGGGSTELRKQLRVLSDFIHTFDLVHLKPDNSIIGKSTVNARALSVPGEQYALYLEKTDEKSLTLNLPAGNYSAEWVNPLNGSVIKSEQLKHQGGELLIQIPDFTEDIALRLIQ